MTFEDKEIDNVVTGSMVHVETMKLHVEESLQRKRA